MIGDILSKTFYKKKRYAYLVSREPRKFKTMHKDGIVVLTHTAWAAITTFVHIGFPRTFDLECGHSQSHALTFNNPPVWD